jgi:hypothetical protein
MTMPPSSPSQAKRPQPPGRKPFFVSWRWRIVLPLFVVVLFVSMLGAYGVAAGFGSSFGVSQDNILLESVRGTTSRADALYRRQLQEAQRVAFTIGIPEAVQLEQVGVLQESLEAMARVAELDSLILTNASGVEVLGVQRVLIPGVDDYAVNSGTVLLEQAIVQAALTGQVGQSGLFRTPEGTLLFLSVPLRVGDEIVGTALAGKHLTDVSSELHGTAVASVAVYGADGELMETTYDLTDAIQTDLRIPSSLMQQALQSDGQSVPVRSVEIAEVPHRVAYVPMA